MSHQTTPELRLSRRRFLSLCAPALGGLALLSATHGAADASTETDLENVPAVLIDISRCQGCGNCQRSCDKANGLPCAEQSTLSAQTYTIVDERQPEPGETRFVKRACMHCLHPGCVSACPVAALHKTNEGLVVADTSKCIGCRYCQYACPFGVPKFEWENTLGVMRKCTGCTDRIAKGQMPACTAGCPTGALKAGTRAELLKEAHARIEAHPDRYINKVYGEFEAGGTSRLYISDVPFEELGLPVVDSAPVPRYAEQIVTKTPTIALSVAAVSTVAYAFLRRREHGTDEDTIEIEEK
jgi:formate dehydrogenase iron-sulfur subunit